MLTTLKKSPLANCGWSERSWPRAVVTPVAWKKIGLKTLSPKWPDKWKHWIEKLNCHRSGLTNENPDLFFEITTYYLVLTVYILIFVCCSKLNQVTWCWLCSLGGGRMCLTGGEGDENMGGGGITPISVTPRLSCISPASETSFNKKGKQDIYLHIFFKNTHSLK